MAAFARTTLAAVALAAVLAACGGNGTKSGDSDVSVADLKAWAAEQAAAPKCADLFASGVTLPEVMPSMCVRDRGDFLAVGYVTCADRRKMYQMTDVFEAWAFEGGTVTTSAELAVDPAYGAAVRECG